MNQSTVIVKKREKTHARALKIHAIDVQRELQTVTQAELLEDGRHMRLDRPLGNRQLLGHLTVAGATGNQSRHGLPARAASPSPRGGLSDFLL